MALAFFCVSPTTEEEAIAASDRCAAIPEAKLLCIAGATDPAAAPSEECIELLRESSVLCPTGASVPALGFTALGGLAGLLSTLGAWTLRRRPCAAAEARAGARCRVSWLTNPMKAKTGGCLCGAVRYEIAGPLRAAEYCHCSMCRKANGGPFSAHAEVDAASFRLLQGDDLVGEFASSPQRRRCFCSRCGSHLFIRRLDDFSTAVITLGTLDSDPQVLPARHVFVDSKASWDDIADGLPRFRVYPGFEPGD